MTSGESHLPALKALSRGRPLVIAHRGYSQLAPENTAPAFELALQAGADLIEVDYRLSKDHQLVVIHDADLDRTTDARRRWHRRRIKVASKTAAEIQELDAGSWFDAKYAGTKVPLLSQALEQIASTAGGVALIERKAGEPAACLELLRELKLINRVILQAFDWDYLKVCHELEPSQVLAALGPPSLLSGARNPAGIFQGLDARWLDELQATGAQAAVWSTRVSRAAVQLAHERALKVWVYTINNVRAARRLLAIGVDGIITNNPALIWKAMALGGEPASE